jgi:spore maturation protein CgeB
MALVLNTNSYVTIAEADSYFETRIDSAEWTSSSDEVKEQALVTATQLIDDRPWIGFAVSSSQALAWPRKEAMYYDSRMGQNITIATNEVPSKVKTAVYEQALHLINNEDLLTQTTQVFENISIGNISISDSNNDVTKISISPALITRPLKDLVKQGANNWWRAN